MAEEKPVPPLGKRTARPDRHGGQSHQVRAGFSATQVPDLEGGCPVSSSQAIGTSV